MENKSKTTASVVIPNLNSKIVDKTIASIKNQSWGLEGVEIIVVGMDVYGLVKDDEVVKFIRTEKPVNPARARNMGVESATGEVIFFIDSDCVADPQWMLILLDDYKDGFRVASGAIGFPSGRYWTLCDNVSIFHEYQPSNRRGERRYLPSTNLMVDRTVFNEIGGFDVTLPTAEDLDFTIRTHQSGYKLLFEPRAMVSHLPDRNSLTSILKRSAVFGENSVRVRQKYAEIFQMPGITRNQFGMLAFSPAIALFAAGKPMIGGAGRLKYFHTFPVLFLAKMAWCIGAARGLAAYNSSAGSLRKIGG